MKGTYSHYQHIQGNVNLDGFVNENETQVNEMETKETETKGYNPDNAIETKGGGTLTPDSILDGIVTNIQDGKVKDFVQNTEKWEGDVNGPAINAVIEVQLPDNKLENTSQVFTYRRSEEGETAYHSTSNIGKFKKKYGSLPKPGVKVKVITDSNGFGKVKLD